MRDKICERIKRTKDNIRLRDKDKDIQDIQEDSSPSLDNRNNGKKACSTDMKQTSLFSFFKHETYKKIFKAVFDTT